MSLARNGVIDSNLSIPEIRKRINKYHQEKEVFPDETEAEESEPLEVTSK